jgi:sec-independent protein translocase protein TatA
MRAVRTPGDALEEVVMFNLGPQELIVLMVIGVLLFGKKLPEVGRSLGRAIVGFKEGLSGIEHEDTAAYTGTGAEARPAAPRPPQRIATTSPKFEDTPGV